MNTMYPWMDGDKTFERICQTLFASAAEGLVVVDRTGTMCLVNPRVMDMFGYTAEELIGNRVELLVPESLRNRHAEDQQHYMAHPLRRSMGMGLDLEARRKDGTTFPVEISLNHFDVEGEMYVMALISDITLRKKAERELALLASQDTVKALKKERQLNELKSRFVSMASHEFRTPLSTILTSISLLSKYTGPSEEGFRQKHFNRIRSSVHNLTAILNDFLSLDKLESGMLAPNVEDFDPLPLMEDLIDEMQSVCKAGQLIVFTFDGERQVHLDRNMLRNIVLNLISNAIKYSLENQVVEVSMKVGGGKIIVTVRDNGIGIPEADQEHLFERFFRAQNAMNIQGTGLGLNIVKKYLDLMEGEIGFESEVGKGTIFSIALPQRL